MVIIALLGPSGSGKSTVEAKLEEFGYKRIISYTTREMRPGEQNHVEYHFVDRDQFEGLIKKNVLLECTEYNGNLYGAPKPVGGQRYVVVVEQDGLKAFKDRYGDQVFSVYISINKDEAFNRMKETRGSEGATERVELDAQRFKGVAENVDMVVDGSLSPDRLAHDIMVNSVIRE